jgi:hypothetical protein
MSDVPSNARVAAGAFGFLTFNYGLRRSRPALAFLSCTRTDLAYFSAKRSYASAILSNRSLYFGADAFFASSAIVAALAR